MTSIGCVEESAVGRECDDAFVNSLALVKTPLVKRLAHASVKSRNGNTGAGGITFRIWLRRAAFPNGQPGFNRVLSGPTGGARLFGRATRSPSPKERGGRDNYRYQNETEGHMGLSLVRLCGSVSTTRWRRYEKQYNNRADCGKGLP